MRRSRTSTLVSCVALLSAAALWPHASNAQSQFPQRPIRLIVPFGAGGVLDVVGRFWAARMNPVLGTVVVENQPGAGGMIGAAEVARSTPDGHMLLLGSTSQMIINPAVMEKLPYDPLKAFVPASILAISANSVVVAASLPAKSLKELIEYAKANPGRLSYGSAGAGTLTQVTGEMFKQMTGLSHIEHVPYKGAGPGIVDLTSGHIPMMTPNVTGQLLDLHRAGKVRILATTTPQRIKAAPEIPTAIESGMPGFIVQLFTAVFAPAATPRAVVEQIAGATQKAMADPEYQSAMIRSGFEISADNTPDKAVKFIRDEHDRLTPVIRSMGLKPH